MPPRIVFPIFIFGDGDCIVLLRNEDIGSELEHYDVTDEVYSGYDYDGRLLKFTTGENMVVRCEATSSEIQHDELMKRLHSHLARLNYCRYDNNNDSITKAMAAGLFAETNFEYQSFLGWLKSIIIGRK
ncbi:hypothetical protein [Desulfovibrio sp. Huiquan2017]|uniref:hypothetical protein n=1 Tax=Desulfovibrio sp. Huiquan2017 TaxID=2816861 RepID=UPI001A915FAA|nr:hypothetical protein [Desulfovibrio sp. Huiquan2017]